MKNQTTNKALPASGAVVKDYVTFSRAGVSVDIARFFQSPEGKKRLDEIAAERNRVVGKTLIPR